MAKYIKLEDLMKFPIRRNHYDKEHGNEDFICGIETVLEYAENLQTTDIVQEWISVDERLPEPKHEFDARNWYLVALSNGVVKELAYEFHNHSVFGYGWRETAYPVTHWMPLPEPPKGE